MSAAQYATAWFASLHSRAVNGTLCWLWEYRWRALRLFSLRDYRSHHAHGVTISGVGCCYIWAGSSGRVHLRFGA